MEIRLFGGFAVVHEGAPLDVVGDRQRGLLFRLALEPGSAVSYRAIAEDLWDDLPENPRASLQNLASRLRTQLPGGALASTPGGYRLELDREAVDVVRFQDLVARAGRADAATAPVIARAALDLWSGEPWTPPSGYDWLVRDLAEDRATALRIAGPDPDGSDDREPPSRIPAPITGLVGRIAELEQIASQLEGGRLVTILGPGGAGKTRLAVEAARRRSGATLVELAPAGPDEVWAAVHTAVGRELRTAGVEVGRPAPAVRVQVLRALDGRDALLVLDNCEHLISSAAEVAADLLAALPGLRILATSREPLGVPGEAFVPLGPLDPPSAERLLSERVRSARGTPIGADEEADAARIRSRLDGLPLALELAAAKARTLSIAEIADGLDRRFDLLTGGARVGLPRHQTLRALVDWSWQLLSDGEREAMVVLAAYPAGVAVGDAGRIAEAHGLRRDDLDALVDKSLLQRVRGRYRALETIREFGLERLGELGRVDEVRTRQALVLAGGAETHDGLLRGPGLLDALEWFDAEEDNLVAAMRWSVDRPEPEAAMRLTAASGWYWMLRDRNEDAVVWARATARFATASDSDAALFIRSLMTMLERFEDDGREAAPPTEDELREVDGLIAEMRTRDGELFVILPELFEAMIAALRSGAARQDAIITIPEDRPLTDWARACLTTSQAAMAQNRGDVELLGAASRRGMELFSAVGDLWGFALARQLHSQWLVLQGRLQEALDLADQAAADLARVSSGPDSLQQRGAALELLARLGRAAEARARAAELLAEARESGSGSLLRFALLVAGTLEERLGDAARARALLAEGESAPSGWFPPQLRALYDLELGVAADPADREGRRARLRAAVASAAESRDQPIMADVALGVGVVALEEGDRATARTALDIARVLRGAPDPTHPRELVLVAGLGEAGTPHGMPALSRGAAMETFGQILRR